MQLPSKGRQDRPPTRPHRLPPAPPPHPLPPLPASPFSLSSSPDSIPPSQRAPLLRHCRSRAGVTGALPPANRAARGVFPPRGAAVQGRPLSSYKVKQKSLLGEPAALQKGAWSREPPPDTVSPHLHRQPWRPGTGDPLPLTRPPATPCAHHQTRGALSASPLDQTRPDQTRATSSGTPSRKSERALGGKSTSAPHASTQLQPDAA